MDQKFINDTRFYYKTWIRTWMETLIKTKDLDENLPWLTQKTEDPKSNKGNLTFTHTVNVIELNCKVINKVK